jgi:PAS domain S-box-containing protein
MRLRLKINRLFLYSYILFIAIFLLLIINFYNDEKENENRENRVYLQTLANIKSNEIKQWLNERLADAKYLYSNAYLNETLPRLIKSHARKDSQRIAKFIEPMFINHDYKNILIIDNKYECVLSLNPGRKEAYNTDSIKSAVDNNKIIFSSFYKSPLDSSIDIDIYAPIFSKRGLKCIIVFKIDPYNLLFPIVQNWYVSKSSGESFIVRRDDDSVVFLNPLRYSNSPPLSLRIPVSTKELPAAMAVRGMIGVVEGTDYRGEKVLADIRPIENTPWFLITKIDLPEIYLPASNRLSFVLLFLFPVFVIAGLSFLYFNSRHSYSDLLKINESTKKFEALYQASNDAILIIENGKIVNCNPKSVEIFKTREYNILNKSLLDLSPPFQPDGNSSAEKLDNFFKSLSKGELKLHEWFFNYNKKETYCEISLSPLVIDEKNYIVAIIRDITKRKQEQEELNESEGRYRSLFEKNLLVMLLIDPDSGQIINANQTACKFYGYTPGEITQLKITDISYLTNEEVLAEMLRAKEGHRKQFFFRHKLANGEIRDVEVYRSPITFKGKTFFYTIVYDITDRKLTEKQLSESEARLRLALDAARGGVWEWNLETNENIWSEELWKLYGLELHCCEPSYETWLKTVHPDDRMIAEQAVQQAALQGIELNAEWRVLEKNGTERWLMSRGQPVRNAEGKVIRYIGTVFDITKRKQIENALSESLILHQTLSRTIPFGMQIVDMTGKILYANEPLQKLSSMIGRRCWEVYKDDKKQCYDCPLHNPGPDGTTSMIEVDSVSGGRTFQIYHTAMTYKNKPALLEIFQDITDRKRTEETINKLSAGIEQSPATIIITDINGNIEYVNPRFTETTGYTFEEVRGKNPRILKSNRMTPEEYKDLWKTILNKKDWQGELLNKKKNGEEFWESALISPILNNRGEIINFIAIKENITEQKKAEEALKQSENRYRSLFANMMEGFSYCKIIYDESSNPIDFEYLEVNATFEKLTGLKNVTGKRVSEVIPGIWESHRELLVIGNRVALTGKPQKFEINFNLLNGWFAISVYSNKKGYFSAIFDNITNQKLAEEAIRESEKQFRTLFMSINEGFYISEVIYNENGDPCDYKYLEVNPKFEEILGLRRDQIIGKRYKELVPVDTTQWLDTYFKVAHTGNPLRYEFYSKEYDRHFLTYTYQTVKGRLNVFVMDITEQKQAEEAIKKYSEELEEKVKERTEQLLLSNKELESFSYSVSHDLRTPLRAINGYAKMLEEDYRKVLDNEGKRLLDVIKHNAVRMGNLIDDLLAFSRLGRKEVQKSKVNMKTLAKETLKELSKAEKHHAEVRIGNLHPSYADSVLMNNVFMNLISNAIKYSSKEGKPVIEIESEYKNGEVIYSIHDNGVGFDMQYAGKLFGVFQRLHKTEEFEGTGVGLAIVQRIIHKHGGRVWAEGKPGEGATFYFSLPVQKTGSMLNNIDN